jgi:hypothetical protein
MAKAVTKTSLKKAAVKAKKASKTLKKAPDKPFKKALRKGFRTYDEGFAHGFAQGVAEEKLLQNQYRDDSPGSEVPTTPPFMVDEECSAQQYLDGLTNTRAMIAGEIQWKCSACGERSPTQCWQCRKTPYHWLRCDYPL